jgi:hypothetical protein
VFWFRFSVDMSEFPTISRINAFLQTRDGFFGQKKMGKKMPSFVYQNSKKWQVFSSVLSNETRLQARVRGSSSFKPTRLPTRAQRVSHLQTTTLRTEKGIVLCWKWKRSSFSMNYSIWEIILRIGSKEAVSPPEIWGILMQAFSSSDLFVRKCEWAFSLKTDSTASKIREAVFNQTSACVFPKKGWTVLKILIFVSFEFLQ